MRWARLVSITCLHQFPLAWTLNNGAGRVFYNARGHFDSTWEDPGIGKMMLQA